MESCINSRGPRSRGWLRDRVCLARRNLLGARRADASLITCKILPAARHRAIQRQKPLYSCERLIGRDSEYTISAATVTRGA